jgi:signal peptidase II
MKTKTTLVQRLRPFLLTVAVVFFDQLMKYLVVTHIPPYTIGVSLFNGIFRIIHVSNTGVAFSVGDSWPQTLRHFLFAVLPLIVIIMVVVIYFKNDTFTKLQRWCIAGIVGGGFGNLIDRYVRAEGVVDFIDVKFFGIFGLDRWPTFNIADSSVVICGIILIISFINVITVESKMEQTKK